MNTNEKSLQNSTNLHTLDQ